MTSNPWETQSKPPFELPSPFQNSCANPSEPPFRTSLSLNTIENTDNLTHTLHVFRTVATFLLSSQLSLCSPTVLRLSPRSSLVFLERARSILDFLLTFLHWTNTTLLHQRSTRSVRNTLHFDKSNYPHSWFWLYGPEHPFYRLCGEVGLVIRLHLLFGGVRSVITVLKVVEEVQKGLQEIKGEWEEEEVGWNGELKVEEWRSLHAWMTWEMGTTQTWATMCCADHDDQNLTTGLCAHGITRALIHVLRFMCAVWKVLWVLWSRCHWCRASCRSVSPRIRNTKCRVLSFWIL